MAVLFEGVPFRRGHIDRAADNLQSVLAGVARQERCDSVILIDATVVYMHLERSRTDATFSSHFPMPVIALDVWNLRETSLRWDFGSHVWVHTPHSLEIPHRLIPVPFVRPHGTPGLYNALPPAESAGSKDPAARAALRAELGVRGQDKLLLLTTARWQLAHWQRHPYNRRIAERLPHLLAGYLAQLAPRPQVVHVGPEPLPFAALGDHYHHLPQMAPGRFAELVGAADMLLSFNTSSTTVGAAVAAGLPTVLCVNSFAGSTVEEVLTALPGKPTEAVVSWLRDTVPLHRFRVWPFGFYDFLSPTLQDNPYTTTQRTVELLDEPAVLAACHALLHDESARAAQAAQQAAYCATVRALPDAAQLVREYCGSAMKRIGYLGAYSIDNTGDIVLSYAVRQSVAELLPSSEPRLLSPAFPHAFWGHAWDRDRGIDLEITAVPPDSGVEFADGLDALIIGGGGIIGLEPSFRPFLLGTPERWDAARVPAAWNAVCSQNEPWYLAGQAEAYQTVKTCCEKLSYVSVRNRTTANFLRRCGFAGRIELVPDPSLLLVPPTGCELDAVLQENGISPRKYLLGLSVGAAVQDPRASGFFADLLGTLAKLLRNNQAELEVVIFPFGQVYGDEQFQLAAAAQIPGAKRIVTRLRPMDYWRLIGRMQAYVGTRYHAMLAAFCQDVPFLVLDEYLSDAVCSSKTREFIVGQWPRAAVPVSPFCRGIRRASCAR